MTHSFIDKRTVDEIFAQTLNITLKDHDNESLLQLFTKSQMREVQNKAAHEDITMDAIVLKEGRNYSSSKLASLFIGKSMSSKLAAELRKAVDSSLSPFININVIDENSMYFKNIKAFDCSLSYSAK